LTFSLAAPMMVSSKIRCLHKHQEGGHYMSQDTSTAAASPLLTLKETAELLRKSPAALSWMIHRGTAPKSALLGGRRMFRRTDVEAYIEAAFAADNQAA